jgi:hypothetical protein
MKKTGIMLVLALGVLWSVTMPPPAFAAYSSHQNDQDINNFLTVYPFAKSTKLDDCSLCHPGGNVTQSGKTTSYGSCDYCHITYGLQTPHGKVPLNPYGQDYKNANGGKRDQTAIRSIENVDSDGDGYTNILEIQALFFPGNPNDHPGLTPAPVIVMNQERILKLPDHGEFLLNNASKSTDWYARYRGVKIKDLLRYAGIRQEATQITVFAPDGFSKTFPINAPDPQTDPTKIQYDVMGPYPHGYYYGGLDFVDYSYDPGYLYDGHIIPDKIYMMLGYLRDGDPLDIGKLVPDPSHPGTLTLQGEGPYRLIVPQKIAGSPDRPSTAPKGNDGWDYDGNKDHNAGFSVRSVAAIRVEPLPTGTTDFAWTEGGWNLVDKARVVIYGAIDPCAYPVMGKVTDKNGKPIPGVKISFGLISLGQVGETKTEKNGRFRIELPVGEYVVLPSKEGYTFNPESVSIQLFEMGHRMEFTASPAP